MQTVQVQDLYSEYNNWLNKIANLDDDLSNLLCSLENYINDHPSKNEVQILCFSSQLKKQARQLTSFNKSIKTKKEIMSQFAKEHNLEPNHILIEDHFLLKKEFLTFTSLFYKTKGDFLIFIEKSSTKKSLMR